VGVDALRGASRAIRSFRLDPLDLLEEVSFKFIIVHVDDFFDSVVNYLLRSKLASGHGCDERLALQVVLYDFSWRRVPLVSIREQDLETDLRRKRDVQKRIDKNSVEVFLEIHRSVLASAFKVAVFRVGMFVLHRHAHAQIKLALIAFVRVVLVAEFGVNIYWTLFLFDLQLDVSRDPVRVDLQRVSFVRLEGPVVHPRRDQLLERQSDPLVLLPHGLEHSPRFVIFHNLLRADGVEYFELEVDVVVLSFGSDRDGLPAFRLGGKERVLIDRQRVLAQQLQVVVLLRVLSSCEDRRRSLPVACCSWHQELDRLNLVFKVFCRLILGHEIRAEV